MLSSFLNEFISLEKYLDGLNQMLVNTLAKCHFEASWDSVEQIVAVDVGCFRVWRYSKTVCDEEGDLKCSASFLTTDAKVITDGDIYFS